MQFIYGQNEISIVEGASNPSNTKFFSPDILTVPTGTTVSWSNDDSTIHTVTEGKPDLNYESPPLFDSFIMTAGKTFSHTFDAAGIFDYWCTLHPFMTGKIIVTDNKTSSTSSNTQLIQQKNSEFKEDKKNFTNYTNDKYGIQFEYPSDWKVVEKTSRFESGPDVMIADFSSNRNINVGFQDPEVSYIINSVDLKKATEIILKIVTGDFGKEYKTIEQPSILSIAGKEFGTFLFTEKDKYEDFAIKYAKQFWIINNNNAEVIVFAFIAPTSIFDNPENIIIRDHLLNSIKFIENNEPSQESTTKEPMSEKKSRFD